MTSAALLATPARSASPAESNRHSIISSAASFTTARSNTTPLTAASQNSLALGSSRNSSTHTLGPLPSSAANGENVNPLHVHSQSMQTANQQKEIHIVKVTGDKVQVETGPVPPTVFHRVGKSLAGVVKANDDDVNVGPPPPSPPASVEHHESPLEDDLRLSPPIVPPKMQMTRSEPPSRSVTLDDACERRASGSSTGLKQFPRSPVPVPHREPIHRASTDLNAPRHAPSLSNASNDSTIASVSTVTPTTKNPHFSVDGYLQPPVPSIAVHRPTRRNTTGSAPRPVIRAATHPQPDTSESERELDSDIQQQAAQIRRERRRKAQQEKEAAMTRPADGERAHYAPQRREDDEKQVLVGNLIGEDHVNYVLMYNMLTGIRIGVSRCQAKIKRPLTDEDFTARHKFSFDIIGNELTPSAKYDFKFKDYAPWVFRELREDFFQLDPADYLLSLTSKYILSELGSPGKSGSFFYFSRDYRFIIKTIRHAEHKFLLSILKNYHAHVKANPHTLLSRFYGLHRVKLPRGRKIHFVIMNNLFPPHRDVHETYDLKGSTVGRLYPEEKAQRNPRAVLKDLNWIDRGKTLELGPENRALLEEQLRRDSELLKKVHVMDYSLLVGIHNMERGNRDNVRSKTLKVFSPEMPRVRRKPTALKGSLSPEAVAMRRAMQASDPKRLNAELSENDAGDHRQQFLFYKDEGGLRATDEENHPMDTVYYLGVIDILTPYNFTKRAEHLWKGLRADRHKISPVPPDEYGNRFFCFMKAIMRGGGGGQRFKAE